MPLLLLSRTFLVHKLILGLSIFGPKIVKFVYIKFVDRITSNVQKLILDIVSPSLRLTFGYHLRRYGYLEPRFFWNWNLNLWKTDTGCSLYFEWLRKATWICFSRIPLKIHRLLEYSYGICMIFTPLYIVDPTICPKTFAKSGWTDGALDFRSQPERWEAVA